MPIINFQSSRKKTKGKRIESKINLTTYRIKRLYPHLYGRLGGTYIRLTLRSSIFSEMPKSKVLILEEN